MRMARQTMFHVVHSLSIPLSLALSSELCKLTLIHSHVFIVESLSCALWVLHYVRRALLVQYDLDLDSSNDEHKSPSSLALPSIAFFVNVWE